MKKITKFFLLAVIIAVFTTLLAISAFAKIYSGNCGTNVKYKLDTSTGVLEISGTGKMTNYSCSPWYSNRSYVKTVKISDGVTSIGNYAFYDCSSLQSIEIPDSVTSIGSSAFEDCSSLQSIVIPDSVTSIYDWTFAFCSSLQSIVIPDSVTSIGNEAFYGCSSLQSIEIPDSVTSIGGSAFRKCSSLGSIVIPDSVTSIGDSAFYYCSSLTSVTFKTKNATIGSDVFNGCSKLETIYLYRNSTADAYFLDDEYTKFYLDAYFMTFEGYQVREDGYNGLRSRFVVDFSAMPTIENGGFNVIEVGAIFVSTDKLNANGDDFVISKSADGTYKTVAYGATVPVIKNGLLVGKYISKTENELVFACTITNFDESKYNKNVSSRGYVVLADAEGNEYVGYCDYPVEEYRSVSLEMICDALFEAGQITEDNISYQNVVAFRKED